MTSIAQALKTASVFAEMLDCAHHTNYRISYITPTGVTFTVVIGGVNHRVVVEVDTSRYGLMRQLNKIGRIL